MAFGNRRCPRVQEAKHFRLKSVVVGLYNYHPFPKPLGTTNLRREMPYNDCSLWYSKLTEQFAIGLDGEDGPV